MAEKAAETRAAGSRLYLLLVLAVLLIAFALGGFYYVQTTETRESNWLQDVRQIQTDVGEVASVGRDATLGITPEFLDISAAAENFAESILLLREGDPESGVVPMPPGVNDQVAAVEQAWQQMKGSLDSMLAGEIPFQRAAGNIGVIESAVTELQQDYQKVSERLAARAAPPAQIVLAAEQSARLQRIQQTALRVISAGRDAVATAAELDTLAKEFVRDNRRIDTGDNLPKEIAGKFEAVTQAIAAVIEDSAAIGSMQTSAATLQGDATNLLAGAKNLEQALIDRQSQNTYLLYASFGAGVLSLVGLLAFVLLAFADQRRRTKFAEDRDARQQQAILGLLDDITNLADGDLTGEVKVTEDFTGAIADSINYTISNMRSLVGTINTTSANIAAAANDTQAIARNMNEASERQAKEITAASNNISASAQSLEQVAARAEELANQAQSSVQIAHSGAETVGRTIQGMAALREQIQDTAKRIKRLGESSQEIGNIIEFINEISEQTNTLALNASIQAAMAGEQGRGFAVVADEVQRLAERAGTATRQIENLVKTIQADTNEAIISMERSTQNVVTGAKSAEEAGGALTKVESSSQELARLISEISSSARNQSASASKIAGTMQVIRDIAVQTSGAAGQTTNAVGELNTLAEKLRESVSGFKLPG